MITAAPMLPVARLSDKGTHYQLVKSSHRMLPLSRCFFGPLRELNSHASHSDEIEDDNEAIGHYKHGFSSKIYSNSPRCCHPKAHRLNDLDSSGQKSGSFRSR